MSIIERAIDQLDKKSGENNTLGEEMAKDFSESLLIEDEGATENTGISIKLADRGLEKLGFLVPGHDNQMAAEEYRMIKRPLLINAFGKGAVPVDRGNLIMVTSSLPSEGKTFSSLNLGLAMATELDFTVLLIDGDVIKPGLTKLLGLENQPGLIDLLLDSQLRLSDVLVSTDMPKLKIIPAGRQHKQSTELLASDQMKRLTDELSERYSDRVILFDAPPILATSHASVLAHLVGQIQMVVEAGKTPQSAIKDAIAQLELDDNQVMGMILNKAYKSFGAQYYGGYYGTYGK